MVESQGKVSEKPGNFEMDIEWQPCINIRCKTTTHLHVSYVSKSSCDCNSNNKIFNALL